MSWGHILLVILGVCHHVSSHIPIFPTNYGNWAEPDSVYVLPSQTPSVSRQQSLQRLTSLRAVMTSRNLAACIVPTADAHNSQYIHPADARREWISGLTGSSGTAVVTSSEALVWTDARYFTQFYMEVNTTYWQLMRQGTDATIQQWLVQNLRRGDVVGLDPTTYTRKAWTSLEAALTQAGIKLLATSENLVDLARTQVNDPPPLKTGNPLIAHTPQFSGKLSSEKLSQLLSTVSARGATALVLTALDDIAYTLNLRGSDIPYNPVFFAYLVLRTDQVAPNNVILFWGGGALSADIAQFLTAEGVRLTVRPYGDVFRYLEELSNELPADSTIWLSDEASHAIHTAAESGARTAASVSPVALVKCVKNAVELAGFRSSHVRDGTAVVRFLRWLHETIDAGQTVTEIDAVDKLEEFRSEEEYYMGPSFSTIAGAGENGAVIHYSPSREGEQRVVRKDDMLLVDSGGQYRDGTTDITRTRHLSSSPTEAQRRAFTRVLIGQTALATTVFPRGIVGHTLETLARKALWDIGLDYGHGTGHGVGHFLKVHEGPSWILSAPSADDPGIVEGMIFSNEPGYYEVNEYGIRHEDLVEVIPMSRDADHILASGLVGDFAGRGALGFYTISLVPHQTACIDVGLLNDMEIKYINDYHSRVLSTIGPILRERNLTEDYEWLEKECAPIARSAAILVKSAPFLTVAIFGLWLGL